MHTQNAAMLGHEAGCSCHKCFANAMGSWIDELGARTSPGQFQVFGTTTFRTPTYPWQRGFPTGGAGRPSPDYAHHLFGRLVSHLERELGSTPDYVVADQYGALKTVEKMARDGRLPARKIGKFWRYRASELDAALRSSVNCDGYAYRLEKENGK